MRRLLAISAIGLVAFVAAVAIALHTPPVQRRILSWSIGELERRFSLELSADSLRFNLITRRVVLSNVKLAATAHRDDPFFTANAITVKLPWVVYRGRLR